MSKTILSTTDIKIETPKRFSESYDKQLNIRKFGDDNLFPQHINDFYNSSPTFHSCVQRMSDFLFGEGIKNSLIDNKLLRSIIDDYAKFNGFSLFVSYNGLGDIDSVQYIPFETIRLGEQGNNGIYTYCYYCPDWSSQTTINKKKVDAKKQKQKYWMFTNDIETRLRRMVDDDYQGGEILYYSNTISYPTPKVNSVLNYVSCEIGLSNLTYRDVRCGLIPSSIVAVPSQSDEDFENLMNNFASLQGDEQSFKILAIQYNSKDDLPQLLNLNGEDYTNKFDTIGKICESKIQKSYNQESFKRLEDGSLGFGSEAISDIYNFYNFQLKTERKNIENCLKQIDSNIELIEIRYDTIGNK